MLIIVTVDERIVARHYCKSNYSITAVVNHTITYSKLSRTKVHTVPLTLLLYRDYSAHMKYFQYLCNIITHVHGLVLLPPPHLELLVMDGQVRAECFLCQCVQILCLFINWFLMNRHNMCVDWHSNTFYLTFDTHCQQLAQYLYLCDESYWMNLETSEVMEWL